MLGWFEAQFKAHLIVSDVVLYDETGIKVKQKISGCFCSEQGASALARISRISHVGCALCT